MHDADRIADSRRGRRQAIANSVSVVHRDESAQILGGQRRLHQPAGTHSRAANDTGRSR